MLKHALYRGNLRHRRYTPVEHAFRFPLYMFYLNLAELEAGLEWGRLCSARRAAAVRFRREDHLGAPEVPLETAVRDLVERETGRRPEGAIMLLTHLRHFGYLMNPLAVYYCFSAEDREVEAVVLEVTNTPWREQHAYVLSRRGDDSGNAWQAFQKGMHVSPFLPMAQEYRARLGAPEHQLLVHLENWQDGAKHLDATLLLKQLPLNGWSLASHLLRFPLMTVQVAAGIYFQALRLWWKGVPFHAHPRRATTAPETVHEQHPA